MESASSEGSMDSSVHSQSLQSSASDRDDTSTSVPSTTRNMTQGASKSAADEKKLVWKETQAVRRSKILVFCVISLFAISASIATFFIVRKNEEGDYELDFMLYAKEVTESSEAKIVKSFGVIGMFSKSVTNMAMTQNATWPFFTLQNFDKVGGDIKTIAFVDAIALAPLVQDDQLDRWNEYSKDNGPEWLRLGLDYRGHHSVDPGPIPDVLFNDNKTYVDGEVKFDGHFLPVWQIADAPKSSSVINIDLFGRGSFEHLAVDVVQGRMPILSDANDENFISKYSIDYNSSVGEERDHKYGSYLMQPVFDILDSGDRRVPKVVAFLIAVFPWSTYFNDILIPEVNGIYAVVSDGCGMQFTYVINGPTSTFVGVGDQHDVNYERFKYKSDFVHFSKYTGQPHAGFDGLTYDERFENTKLGHCFYTLTLYSSAGFKTIKGQSASLYAAGVAAIFVVILLLLVMYDFMVNRRQNRLMATAIKTDAIVASLFPKEIKHKLMEDAGAKVAAQGNRRTTAYMADNFANDRAARAADVRAAIADTKPIADLFPETTIFFADIAGFTAWSSAREPAQVFTLLENIYHAFDGIAESRRVFKIETIGDCYVAVVGLPVPRKDHAVTMCRFARDCLNSFNATVRELELSLGPDTADLGLRVGLHSGPVTAGVLRGERSRFQLFGDTVNTASRMESNGLRDRIHVSQDTADYLIEAGKGHWVQAREDKIVAKGKGELQTFWVNVGAPGHRSQGESCSRSELSYGTGSDDKDETRVSDFDDEDRTENVIHPSNIQKKDEGDFDDERQERLIDWNTDCLLRFLKEIEARRKLAESQTVDYSKLRELENVQLDDPLDEVVEIIYLPTYQDKVCVRSIESIDLGVKVKNQLRDYIQTVANMYRKNAFHNFEHASHVSMSVIKLLARIVAPTNIPGNETIGDEKDLHDHTYGITSDPLTQFACSLSAMIHDVDHSGVPNMQLIKEKSKLATVYKNKSVAEQNSVDLAWALLMDDSFTDFRRAIYHNESEFRRFRQLVVNSVMATDIMDKDLKTLRNNRWDKAFKEEVQEEQAVCTNRKATIVIEHLIQASDVAHTMQHWHIYRKWNERFFVECYKAWKQGRSETNPIDNWYKGEIGFFDFYIIPLAKKLKDCGVFGVSSDEYLNYAQKNRKEWEAKGLEVVESMVEKVKSMEFGPPPTSLNEMDKSSHTCSTLGSGR